MISIITTVKNGSKYILETLESIKDQTFKEFEHIIVDDGSTDNTVQLLEVFQKQNPEYKLFIFQPGNLGRGKALNFAVSKANFNWVAIIDADDIWHPQKLEAQMTILRKNPDITVLATKTGLFSDSVKFDNFNNGFTFEFINPKKMLYKSIISHSSVIIKKKDTIYDESRTSQFDAELWYRLAFDKKKTLAIINQQLNFHRIHQNQSFEASKGQSYQKNAIKLSVTYCLKTFTLFPIIIYLLKFLYRSIVPRKLRFKKVK
ncbi:glycosyltransferase family 2 protein [Flavobacterium sp. CBA20B-1]|uniref:glycosyltransferase family 2 protein n=1 Tax=unclassified Flavobacterium TaxID=196869 RepID=UPI0022250864|nr:MULTISPECIES: glycosyltransferase family A protein [unclassified Flavobacterium]WCM42249.1 glycosyltransferase family 2 protein [Flavobacterium sp. CBA20B-1]